MNYNRIYASIVLRAQNEYCIRKALKRDGNYFEDHHIIPRSLGGSNARINKALLTAREHFICHWLLVKMYPSGTVERSKMLYAFWRMNSSNAEHCRYSFSNAYTKLREEFSSIVGQTNSKHQCGKNNSNYGNKWYTNSDTGVSKLFAYQPTDKHWIPGRNLFNGQRQSILYLYDGNGLTRPPKYLLNTRRKEFDIHQHDKAKLAINKAHAMWDAFHQSNCASLSEFSRQQQKTRSYARSVFNKFIPIFSKLSVTASAFKPSKSLIGVYK